MTDRIILARKPACGCIEAAEVYDSESSKEIDTALKDKLDWLKRGLDVTDTDLSEYKGEPLGCSHKVVDVMEQFKDLLTRFGVAKIVDGCCDNCKRRVSPNEPHICIDWDKEGIT